MSHLKLAEEVALNSHPNIVSRMEGQSLKTPVMFYTEFSHVNDTSENVKELHKRYVPFN